MNNQAQNIYNSIQDCIQKTPFNEFLLSPEEAQNLRSRKTEQIIKDHLSSLPESMQQRLRDELDSWGPLSPLLIDESITEILVNGPSSIWIEKNGLLEKHPDVFFSDLSYRNCLDRISHESKAFVTMESPCADGTFKDFRLSLISSDLSQGTVHFSLRRHPKNPWTFDKMHEKGWCSEEELALLKKIILQKSNFMVVGPTGAGKTSVLNSFLNLLPENERAIIIEDTSEIVLPNKASMKLLTREDPQGVLPNIDQSQLVKRSLRLRPDRLVMGEIRGGEAKDFLMTLATGHSGSFGTLHAQDAGQALLRLEMLIQMGAPQWSLTAIRRLIHMSLNYIVVTGKDKNGNRKLKGVYRLCSLEEQGILIEPVDLA